MFVIEVINSSDFLLLVFFTVFNYRILPVTIHTLTLVEHRKLKLYIFMNKNLWTQFTITSLKSLEQTVDVFIFNADYKKVGNFKTQFDALAVSGKSQSKYSTIDCLMPLKKRKKKEKESVRRTSIVWGFGAIESTTVIEIFDSIWLWTIELYSKKEKAKARPKMPRGTSSHERAFHKTLSKMVVKWNYSEIHNYSGSCLMRSLWDQAKPLTEW